MFTALAVRILAQPLADPSPGNRPTPGNADLPGNLNSKLGDLMGWGLRIGYVACFFGFLYCAGRMAISHQRGEEVNFVGLGTTAAACLILGSAAAIADTLIF